MSGFAGFSDADILKVQKGQDPVIKKTGHEYQNKLISSNAKRKISSGNKNQKLLNNKLTMIVNSDLPEEAKLSVSNNNTAIVETIKLEVVEDVIIQHNLQINPPEKKIIDLDEFQNRQKLMEEQNRRRKELLAKALADRTKRTLEEQQRLNEIQNELRKLDISLSNDVKILRKEIEAASIEYMEAQKRYNRVEKEFLDAKLHLHQKLDKKEMLTEHLCAIIEKNEERKGDKLNELLQKLEVKDIEKDVWSDEVSLQN